MKDPNENRLGYKKTKGGWIPKEWEYAQLTQVAQLESGHTPSREEPKYWDGDIPWVSLHDTDNLDGREIIITKLTVSQDGINNSSARLLPAGTVIFSRTATVGKATILGREMATSQDFANFICGARLHNLFLVQLLRGMTRQWHRLMAGSTHSTIYMPAFKSLFIVLPPRREQIQISSILFTCDDAIERTRDLIAIKKEQKKALMQQLLTGKKRLPGFKDKWKSARLEQISTRLREVAEIPAEHLVLSITAGTGFVSQQDKFSRVIAGKQVENYVRLKRGEFAYNKGNSFRYPQGCVYQLTEYGEGLVPDVFYSFKLDDKRADPEFIKQYFLAGLHNKDLYRWINSGVRNNGLLNLSASDFFNLPIQLPGLSEQKEIGRVMKAADDEINALTSKLAGLKEQKKGLMQKLLTGQIRVKV